jgi:hypothetical protein
MLIEEPIYSLRSPGEAGKCRKASVRITPVAARGLALPEGYYLSPLRGFGVACGWTRADNVNSVLN